MCPHGGVTCGRPIDPPSLSLWHLLTSYIYHSHINQWHIRPLAKHFCHYFSRWIQREISVMREVRGILRLDWLPWEGFSFFFSFLFSRSVTQLYDLLYAFFLSYMYVHLFLLTSFITYVNPSIYIYAWLWYKFILFSAIWSYSFSWDNSSFPFSWESYALADPCREVVIKANYQQNGPTWQTLDGGPVPIQHGENDCEQREWNFSVLPSVCCNESSGFK